jgi:hypothetical protein
MPGETVRRFDDINGLSEFSQEEKSIETYLNNEFGRKHWEYDDTNFTVKLPARLQDRTRFPIEVSYGDKPISNGSAEIIAYAIIKIRVIEKGKELHSERNVYTGVTKLVSFKFQKNAFPFLATRVSLLPVEIVSMFFVYKSPDPNETIKVVKHEQAYNLNGPCIFTNYVKGDNKYLEGFGLEKYDFSSNRHLNPNNEIPSNTFKAVYFNTNNPNVPVFTQYTDDIIVNQSYSFKGINLKDLGAYWVGNFTFTENTTLLFNIVFSYSIAKVLIDDTIIYQTARNGSTNREILVDVEKGVHKIAVEFISNYFSPGLSVVITPERKYYNFDELKNILQLDKDEYNIWYAGVHESTNVDDSITVTLNRSEEPVVILLQSLRPVKWNIKNPFDNNIKAIIVGGAQHGSRVIGDASPNSVYFIRRNLGSDTRFPDDFLGKKINGHAGKYGATGLEVF